MSSLRSLKQLFAIQDNKVGAKGVAIQGSKEIRSPISDTKRFVPGYTDDFIHQADKKAVIFDVSRYSDPNWNYTRNYTQVNKKQDTTSTAVPTAQTRQRGIRDLT